MFCLLPALEVYDSKVLTDGFAKIAFYRFHSAFPHFFIPFNEGESH
jgi:hypothetical protein